MIAESQTRWSRLENWVQTNDPYAAHHLPLLAEAERLLSAHRTGLGRPLDLADKLERWRYQMLSERRGRLQPQEREVSESLDLAANALAGWPRRLPRRPRLALVDATHTPVAAGRGIVDDCLDPGRPVATIEAAARAVTEAHFRVDDPVVGEVPTRPVVAHRRPMLLYAPLYVSNYCINYCTYCGFRHPNPIERIHLEVADVLAQARILESWGMRQVLVVAGDYPKLDSPDYLCTIVKQLTDRGLRVSVEIAPQRTIVYSALIGAGACGLALYQETYDEAAYARFHPRGTKTWFDWRLEGPERAAEAGIPRVGLGILLGLADPRADLINLINHGRYLEERFGHLALAFSLPRIHEAPAGFVPPHAVDDETFVRMYCALRLSFPRAHLVLSTRESAALRGRLALSCITQMSAGSSTAPGGYEHAADDPCRQQFPVADHRSPAEVVRWLEEHDFAACWDAVRTRA